MFTYDAALSQAMLAATVYVPGRSAAYENHSLMKPMKMTCLAEIFKLLIYLLELFMMDFHSLECREVYKNTTLVFSVEFRRSWYKTSALLILIYKNIQVLLHHDLC